MNPETRMLLRNPKMAKIDSIIQVVVAFTWLLIVVGIIAWMFFFK